MASNTTSTSMPVGGIVNLVDVARMSISMPLEVLSRYAAGRVNPYTSEVGSALCRNFRLGEQGSRNIRMAVESLICVGSLGNILEFGFGIRDVVRLMAQSDGGSTCLALCAALKDTFADDVAIDVLIELTRLIKVDGEYMPSGLEWKNLLNACAGTLATSTFPLHAEFLMSLVRDDGCLEATDSGLVARPLRIRPCSTPKSIAKALYHLAEISQERLQTVTLVGGPDSGWIAAVAEWFLDLRVAILGEDGTQRYANTLDLDGVQVRIVAGESAEATSWGLQAVGCTHRLEDASELFEAELRPRGDACVSGRVDWRRALSSTFHDDFKKLMADPQGVGELIGSAARLFKALAHGDPMFSNSEMRACVGYCDQSYGRGFLNNIVAWLPELEASRQSMGPAAARSVTSAKRAYDSCVALIKTRCNCTLCQIRESPGSPRSQEEDEENREHRESDEEMTTPSNLDSIGSGQFLEDDRYCLLVMAETFILLGRCLANVVLETKLLTPKRSGIEMLYSNQFNVRHTAMLNETHFPIEGQIRLVLDRDADFGLGGVADSGEEASEVKLQTILELFSGRVAPPISTKTTALCLNGICAYLGVLVDDSGGRDAVGKVHVLTGRIQYQKKSYDKVEDQAMLLRDRQENFSQARAIADSGQSFKEHALIVNERSERLSCWFEISGELGGHVTLRVGPGSLATSLASRRGLIRCQLRKKKATSACDRVRAELVSPGLVSEAKRRNTTLEIAGKSIEVLHGIDSHTATAIIASSANLDPCCSVYIVERYAECLECCIRAVLEVNRPERSHFAIVVVAEEDTSRALGEREERG